MNDVEEKNPMLQFAFSEIHAWESIIEYSREFMNLTEAFKNELFVLKENFTVM